MEEIKCGVDGNKCSMGMCSKCDKHTQEKIKKALDKKYKEYEKVEKEYKDFRASVRRKYLPSCNCGYDDCVLDPEYIKAHHPEWYARMAADGYPKGGSCESCIDGSNYDDEDK